MRAGCCAWLLPLLLVVAPAHAALDIQHWSTAQGARVYFVANHDLPMLDLAVFFDAGSARDGAAKSGLASLTHTMLARGAGDWNETEIAERFADVGASLSDYFDADRAGFTLRMLSAPPEREPAIATLKAMLAAPHFTQDILARERARTIAGLREAALKPDYLADRAITRLIFGEHPYALAEAGEPESVAALQRDDLVEFHRRHYRTANLVLALMGDISRSEAERIADLLAAALPEGEAAPALVPVPMAVAGSEERIAHHASQSHIALGLPGMSRDDPDYFPLLVGNYILGGGGFDSRLMREIRQERGLAYSAYSYFQPMRVAGPFRIGLQTRRESTTEALELARETLARFVAAGPTPEELEQARNSLIGSFPLRLDSNRKILDYLAMLGFYGLPLDWLQTYPARVAAVSAAEVHRAFRARVPPAAVSTVVVGGQLDPAAP